MALTRLMVMIPTRGRKEIVRQCIPTVEAGMAEDDRLVVYDDAKMGLGIEQQRKLHFRNFARDEFGDFTHLYLTDSDALHDPLWRTWALFLQAKYGGAPVCLYNTDAHVRLGGNTIKDNSGEDVIWRRYAPGISYLLTVEHVRIVMQHIDQMTNWDWQVCDWLGNRMAISRRSFVDHIGYGGIHHPENEGFNGGDIAIHPTDWLIQKRKEVVATLEAT